MMAIWLLLAWCLVVSSALASAEPSVLASARARRDADEPLARCAPEAGTRCQPTKINDIFIVNDKVHRLNYFEGDLLEAWCAAAALQDAAWPRFTREQRFGTVALFGCAPPANASYAQALRALNITVVEQLHLHDLHAPGDVIPAAALADLPASVQQLRLAARASLRVQHGALAALGVRALRLTRVRAAPPRGLRELELTSVGMDALPVPLTDMVVVKINEENRVNVSAGDQVAKGFMASFLGVPSLEVRGVRRALGGGFLRGAGALRLLAVTRGELAALPADLLAYSPGLRALDLRDNRLQALPRGLFNGVPRLESLSLAGNRLHAAALGPLAPLASLVFLRLDRNPLGDLCAEGVESSPLASLHMLHELDLSSTNATRVCRSWLALPALRSLALRQNAVRALPCAPRALPCALALDVRGNPLERVECSRDDYERASGERPAEQVLTVSFDRPLVCECAAHWAQRVGRRGGLALNYRPARGDRSSDLVSENGVCNTTALGCEA